MFGFLLARLAEPSTWRGLFAFATASGLAVSPDQANAIMTIGLAGIGAVGVFTKDKS